LRPQRTSEKSFRLDQVAGSQRRHQATVRKLKDKATTAFAQNHALKYPFKVFPGGLEVADEIHALGGGPRVISSTPRRTASPSSITYPPEQANSFIHSLSPTPVTGSAPEDYVATHPSGQLVHESGPSPFPGVFTDIPASSIVSSFDFTGVAFSSHFPEFTVNALPSDFDIATTAPTQTTPGASSVLEELGLGGEWQPVMDDLGL
jgi:hypothetical protein